ncbi:MAG: hypothetical protein RL318_3114 [Fibrobacterota bacterium]
MGTVLMLSRVADSLYWMGRYLERAEHTARLIEVNLKQMLDETPEVAEKRWDRVLSCLRVDVEPGHDREAWAVAATLMFNREHMDSIAFCVSAARENARQVREQLTSEIWEQLNSLYLYVREACSEPARKREPHQYLRKVMLGCQQVHGVIEGILYRGEGWRFIQAGRALERGCAVTALLSEHSVEIVKAVTEGGGQFLSWAGILRSCTAFEAYSKTNTADIRPDRMMAFLLVAEHFPRSVLASANLLHESLVGIGGDTNRPDSFRPERLAGKLAAHLGYIAFEEVKPQDYVNLLKETEKSFLDLSKEIQLAWIEYSTPAFADNVLVAQ